MSVSQSVSQLRPHHAAKLGLRGQPAPQAWATLTQAPHSFLGGPPGGGGGLKPGMPAPRMKEPCHERGVKVDHQVARLCYAKLAKQAQSWQRLSSTFPRSHRHPLFCSKCRSAGACVLPARLGLGLTRLLRCKPGWGPPYLASQRASCRAWPSSSPASCPCPASPAWPCLLKQAVHRRGRREARGQ